MTALKGEALRAALMVERFGRLSDLLHERSAKYLPPSVAERRAELEQASLAYERAHGVDREAS